MKKLFQHADAGPAIVAMKVSPLAALEDDGLKPVLLVAGKQPCVDASIQRVETLEKRVGPYHVKNLRESLMSSFKQVVRRGTVVAFEPQESTQTPVQTLARIVKFQLRRLGEDLPIYLLLCSGAVLATLASASSTTSAGIFLILSVGLLLQALGSPWGPFGFSWKQGFGVVIPPFVITAGGALYIQHALNAQGVESLASWLRGSEEFAGEEKDFWVYFVTSLFYTYLWSGGAVFGTAFLASYMIKKRGFWKSVMLCFWAALIVTLIAVGFSALFWWTMTSEASVWVEVLQTGVAYPIYSSLLARMLFADFLSYMVYRTLGDGPAGTLSPNSMRLRGWFLNHGRCFTSAPGVAAILSVQENTSFFVALLSSNLVECFGVSFWYIMSLLRDMRTSSAEARSASRITMQNKMASICGGPFVDWMRSSNIRNTIALTAIFEDRGEKGAALAVTTLLIVLKTTSSNVHGAPWQVTAWRAAFYLFFEIFCTDVAKIYLIERLYGIQITKWDHPIDKFGVWYVTASGVFVVGMILCFLNVRLDLGIPTNII